jgi:predicted Zn-dependent peptidase
LIEVSQLDCGITVVTERMPDVRSVTTGFWVGTGSRDEEPHFSGASHFLEHLLFKGTADRTAQDIAEAVDAVGGDINAFTTKEYTAFYVRLLADSLDLGLDILSDIMWSPAFRPDEVEAERQVILEEILMHQDEPADLVHEVFSEALYPGDPLGREVLGDEQTITGMAREQIAAFHAEHYRPGNIVLAAAGYLEHEHVAEGIQRRFAGGQGDAAATRQAPSGPQSQLAVVNRPTEQAHLIVGVPAIDRDDERRFIITAMNHVLGGGMSSRLFQQIREKRGLAYSVYSYRAGFEHAGFLGVYAGTAPSRVHEVLELIDTELDRMAGDGITERELTMAKGHLVGSLALGLEDSAARMSRIGRSQLVHHNVLQLDELTERIQSVTVDEVAELAAEVLGGPRTLAVVGPFEEAEFGDYKSSSESRPTVSPGRLATALTANTTPGINELRS